MGKLRPFVRKDSYMPNKKWIPFVIGNGYTTTDGASGPAPEYETVTGNPVSFNAITPFPLRQLSVAFSPVQDLHGYDAPWPAGGGANLRGDLPLAQDFAARFTSGTLDTTNKTFTFPYNTTEANEPLPSVPTFEENTQYTFILTMKNDGIARTNLQILYTDGTSSYFADLSGAGVKQTVALSSTAGKTVKTLARRQQGGATIVYYEESGVFKGVLTASQFAPYSNLCPILGWDSLNVEQRGKNLWGKQLANNAYVEFDAVTGEQYTVSAKMIDPEATTYLQLAKAPVGTSTWSSMGYVISGKVVTTRTFTAEDGYKYALWSNASYTNVKELQIELGSTASPYQPYNGRSISISLGSTYYSGTVDVVTGVVTVTHTYQLLNNTSKWVNSSGTVDYYYNGEFTDRKLSPTSYTGVICSYVQIRDQSGVAYGRWQSATNYRFGIKANGTGLTLDDVKAAATAGKIAICYELATPLTIQLTPQEVESLAGDNTMWTDAQNLEVTYRKN